MKNQLTKRKKVLDIGCGPNKVPGSIGIDVAKLSQVDIKWDLDKFPWPIKNNTFDEIHCYHYLEHCKNLKKAMQEIHRIIKRQGKVIIRVPHFSSIMSVVDPTHKRFFALNTFNYFEKNHPASYYFKFHFEVIRKRIKWIINYPNEKWYEKNLRPQSYSFLRKLMIRMVQYFIDKFPYYYERYLIFYTGGADEVYVELKKV